MAAGEEQQGTPQEHTQETNGGGTPDPNRLTVVGIGASAGGIRALQTFFHAIPPNAGIVFVVVMHLSPEHESALPQVLEACTTMPVQQVVERISMESDHIYVIPPNQHLKIVDGHLEVVAFVEPRWGDAHDGGQYGRHSGHAGGGRHRTRYPGGVAAPRL